MPRDLESTRPALKQAWPTAASADSVFVMPRKSQNAAKSISLDAELNENLRLSKARSFPAGLAVNASHCAVAAGSPHAANGHRPAQTCTPRILAGIDPG